MRQSKIPLDGVFNSPRYGTTYPEGWTLGLVLPWCVATARAYLPSSPERRAIGSRKSPFWLVLDYDLQAQVTDNNGVSPTGNFVALAIVSTATRTRGFRTQFRQLADEQGNGFALSPVPIDDVNAAGTAQRPLFLKHPYPMPNHLSLLNRTANKALSTDPSSGRNAIQICIYGVRDWGEAS